MCSNNKDMMNNILFVLMSNDSFENVILSPAGSW